MTPELSVVVVTHRSAIEALACVASLRAAFQRSGLRGEVVVVDCGSGPEEGEALSGAADVLLLLPENRGYSGGVNAGLARARSGRLILANADVVFEPDALVPLLAALEEPSVGAAAPLALWDSAGRVRLPAGFGPGFGRELGLSLAGRWPARDARRFAVFARDAVRLWTAGGRAEHLSGAVLAVRRDAFDRVGRFDERFLFEYEETEWEDRLRAAGLELRFVPSARVRHLWGVSASRNAETARRREASRELYRTRRYGRAGRALLDAARSLSRPPRFRLLEEPSLPARPGAWLAISPNPSRLPFAGAPLETDFRLPREIARSMAAGRWYWSVFSPEDGALLDELAWEKTA